jgi:chromosome segregation ATPase
MQETLTTAQSDLKQAEQGLAALQAEQREIPARIKQAALDGGDVVSLKLRLDELPSRIFGNEVNIRRARAAVIAAELAIREEKDKAAKQAQSERGPGLHEEIESLRRQMEDKELQLRHLMSAETAAAFEVVEWRARLADAQRSLDHFINLEIEGEPKPERVQVVGSADAQWSAARGGVLPS